MKKHKFAVVFTALLTAFTVLISLDTFVLADRYQVTAQTPC